MTKVKTGKGGGLRGKTANISDSEPNSRANTMEIGKKIKDLRIQKGLTQEELANRTELSKGFISQLERDLTSPSIATLQDILQCLGSDLSEFFRKKTGEQIVFSKEDYFTKEEPQLHATIQWIIPNAQKNQMEPILLRLEPGGSTYPDTPHEGEEFGYVLKGDVTIHLDGHTHTAKSGEAFYFTPATQHYLTSRRGATLIWVSTPPSF